MTSDKMFPAFAWSVTRRLDGLELGVPQHEPFAAFGKVYLHARLGTGTLEIENHPFAKHRVLHALAQAEGGLRNGRIGKRLLLVLGEPPNGLLTLLERRTS